MRRLDLQPSHFFASTNDGIRGQSIVVKRIKFITLGGTIAMIRDEHGHARPALDAEMLVAAVPGITQVAQVDVETLMNVPSPYLTPRDIFRLSRYISDLAAQGYYGVVITQGTDTLEETVYFLDLLVKEPISVIVTGAQRDPALLSADGPVNIMEAIQVACDEATPQLGAMVVFGSQVLAGSEVVKTHTSRLDTFKSPELGPLGVVDHGQLYWLRRPVMQDRYSPSHLDARVEVMSVNMGSDGVLLDAAVRAGAQGIVLQALGGGHVPPPMIPVIEATVQKGIPVVMTSRCHSGRLMVNTYGYEGSETHLRRIGVILGSGLSASKARVKLITLLGMGLGVEQVRHEFEKHLGCV